MPLETGITDSSTPDDLNKDWPLGSDPKSEGDDHIRNTKHVLKNFFDAMNFAELPAGTVPAIFGGELGESGTIVKQGGWDVIVAAEFRMAFQRDPATNTPSPVTFTPVGGNSRPFSFKTEDAATIILQPVDTETSTAPIAFPFTVTTNVFIKTFTFRGAALVNNCRVTVRETDINGRLIATTATNQELKTGGGFTIAGTGDTIINLPQLWSFFLGDPVFIILDRYDATTDTIVTSGITAKGATIEGDFIPYFERNGHIFVREEIAHLIDVQQEVDDDFSASDVTIAATATVLVRSLTTAVLPARNYRWELYMLVAGAGGAAANLDIEVIVDGTVQNVINDTVGRVHNAQTGNAQPFYFEGKFNLPIAKSFTITVNGIGVEPGRTNIVHESRLRLVEV